MACCVDVHKANLKMIEYDNLEHWLEYQQHVYVERNTCTWNSTWCRWYATWCTSRGEASKVRQHVRVQLLRRRLVQHQLVKQRPL